MGKNLVLLLAAALSVLPLAAQRNTREEISADIERTGGVHFLYPTDQPVPAAAPKGYKPFYVSHVGRHGSRYALGSTVYEDLLAVWNKASEQGLLTPEGQQFYKDYLAIYPVLCRREGILTEKGQAQHRYIASRIYRNYPEVFKGKTHAEAVSTVSHRVIASMFSFLSELDNLDKDFTFHADYGHPYQAYLLPDIIDSSEERGGEAEVKFKRFRDNVLDLDAMLARWFKRTRGLVDNKYKFCFENQLFASIYGHTMLCQRSFIQNEEYWIPSIWYDWSLSIYAYLNNGVAVVNEPLNLHRQHEQEVSQVDYGSHNILSPYINGYAKYRQLQKDSNWQLVYNLILTNTTDKQPLVHQFCKLLLKEGLLSLFRLCCLCLKHREKVYTTRQTHGIMGAVRGFFFPFIHAYYTNIYKNCL